jgi:hypothetical protein
MRNRNEEWCIDQVEGEGMIMTTITLHHAADSMVQLLHGTGLLRTCDLHCGDAHSL